MNEQMNEWIREKWWRRWIFSWLDVTILPLEWFYIMLGLTQQMSWLKVNQATWDIKDNLCYFSIERWSLILLFWIWAGLVTCLANRRYKKWYSRNSRLSHKKACNFCWSTFNTGESLSCLVRSPDAPRLRSRRYHLWHPAGQVSPEKQYRCNDTS